MRFTHGIPSNPWVRLDNGPDQIQPRKSAPKLSATSEHVGQALGERKNLLSTPRPDARSSNETTNNGTLWLNTWAPSPHGSQHPILGAPPTPRTSRAGESTRAAPEHSSVALAYLLPPWCHTDLHGPPTASANFKVHKGLRKRHYAGLCTWVQQMSHSGATPGGPGCFKAVRKL